MPILRKHTLIPNRINDSDELGDLVGVPIVCNGPQECLVEQ